MSRPPKPAESVAPELTNDGARTEVTAGYRAYLQAMRDGDTDTLDDLLGTGFTLTHITGYVQPKAEWLAQMNAGQFVYHTITEQDAKLTVTGDHACLVGRIVTDATVYGTRANWRLQLTLDYTRVDDAWTVLRAIATTW